MPITRLLDRFPHITTIECRKCGGKAYLVGRRPDAFRPDGKTETWAYECSRCGNKIAETVKT
jgi:ribosomal protein L37E